MPLCSACGQENPDVARFCLACGRELAAAAATPAAPVEERKVVTVLFCDIVGSTATAEQLDPEDVRARLAPYFARAREELERYGGTVEKFIGDAVVALFGAPLAHEDDPERAVRAAVAIRHAIAELNADDAWLDLHIRIAVHTDEALVVLSARAREGEGIAAGDVMNTAARLQGAAPVDGIVVAEATYRATSAVAEYRELEPVRAKGKAAPVPVWELVSLNAEQTRRAAAGLVGRQRELDELWAVWKRVRTRGRAAAVTVLGEPGIGKSRLISEFAASAAADASVYWGRCLPYGEGITYWPVIEILRTAAGIRHDDDPATDARKLGELLEGLGTDQHDELRTMAAALANLIGAPATPRGTFRADDISQAELHWGVRRALELLAATSPLVLVFEDLHWAEPTLLELLQSVVEHVHAPILIVASARPELEARSTVLVTEARGRRVLRLDTLSAEEAQALLAQLLGEHTRERPLEKLLRTAGGNPLFLEETVRMLSQWGALDDDAGLEDPPVPSTLQALIGSRLDQLPVEEKHIAQGASVVGGVFWKGAVAHVLDADHDPAQGLDGLKRRDFVHEHDTSAVAGEREYAFKHILIRDVAYSQLPKRRRAPLHAACADWITALAGDEEEFVEIVAYHLEQACRLARDIAKSPIEPPILAAIDALTRSAQKAERREGIREADRFYARALELLSDDDHPEAATELRLRRCGTLVALGELRAASEQLLDVAERALELHRPDIRGSALVALANIDKKQGRAADSRPRLKEAQQLAAAISDRALEVRALYEIAHLRAWFEGGADEALDELGRGVAIAEQIGDRALRIEGHMRMGSVLYNVGELAHAEEQFERCIALAGDAGSFRDEARATTLLGFVRFYRAEIDEAERLALQALEWLERTCDNYLQLQNLRALGRYALLKGSPKLAERRLREALPLALEVGGWLVVDIYRYLIDALLEQGQAADARDLAEFAGRNLPAEDLYAQAAFLLAEASLAVADADASQAQRCFERAIALLEDQHLRTDLGETRVAFARALERFGDPDAARAQLELARELFSQMQASATVAEIDHELAQVGRAAAPAALRRSSRPSR